MVHRVQIKPLNVITCDTLIIQNTSKSEFYMYSSTTANFQAATTWNGKC